MVDTEKPKLSITKKIIQKAPSGHVLEEKYVSVEGNTLAEAKKVFDEVWKDE